MSPYVIVYEEISREGERGSKLIFMLFFVVDFESNSKAARRFLEN